VTSGTDPMATSGFSEFDGSDHAPAGPNDNPSRGSQPRAPVDGSGESWYGYTCDLPDKWSLSAPWMQSVQRRRIVLFDELARRVPVSDDLEEERAFLAETLLADANSASRERVGLLLEGAKCG